MIYLDYCANTPADQDILDEFVRLEQEYIGNANAAYDPGFQSKAMIEKGLEEISKILKIRPSEIIFTSGASEANNLAAKGYALANRHYGRHIISNQLEHPSLSGALTFLQERGFEIEMCRLDDQGRIDIEHLRNIIREDTILVSACALDSELGIMQPLEQIRQIVSSYPHCALLCDGTQALGKIPVDLSCCDLFSLSAHKFFGLNGSGLLYKREDIALEPLIHGGHSTSIYRSGTPTLALDLCLASALKKAIETQSEHHAYVETLNNELRHFFSQFARVQINSPADAAAEILNIGIEGIKGSMVRDLFNEKGVCVSLKSACSVESLPSKAIMAMYHDRKRALSSLRISLSYKSTFAEIAEFEKIFAQIYRSFYVS